MVDQNEPMRSKDEVSVVELLATVIRRRLWVIWTTALGTLLAGTILFFLPSLGFSLLGDRTLSLQAQVRTISVPPIAQSSINFDIPGLVQSQAGNLGLLVELYRTTLMTEDQAKLELPALNTLVRTRLEKDLTVQADPRNSTVLLTLKVKQENQEKGSRFLALLVDRLRTDIRKYTVTFIQAALSNLEGATKGNSELAVQVLAPFDVASRALKGLLANPDFPVAVVGGVDVLEEEQAKRISRPLVLVVSILGSVFLGVILAFASEAVARSRRDPDTVELFRKAWKGE